MINLKKTLSSLLLIMVACGTAQADNSTNLPVYQNIINEINVGYEDTQLTGTIELENGCVMQIVDYKTRDDNVMKKWHAGEVVAFDAHIMDDALILSAKKIHGPDENKVEPYVIFDFTNTPTHALRVVEINDHGKFVKLSDNSVWEFSWFNRFSTKHWTGGERVLVNGNGDKNSYEFINLDAPVAKKVASATGQFIAH